MFLLNQVTHRMIIQYHPYIGHLFVPNLEARLPNELGGYFVKTNSWGFRSDWEFRREKSERPRILFFGDSYTAGDQCENHERFSERVGELLDAEVYNFGLSGSGTDQHVLIQEHFAKDIEADLIVLCVQVDSIRRIQVSHRESIDRVTGKKVWVPKPYYQLRDGELILHHVPVPLERPTVHVLDATSTRNGKVASGLLDGLLGYYRKAPRLEPVRRIVRSQLPRVQSEVYRMCDLQPYKDYRSAGEPGWQLMEAIIQKFVTQVVPTPVLIVPVPTYEFSRHGAKPIYQPLFNNLEDQARGVHVLDISTPLSQLPWETRQRLAFRGDNHFSRYGHQQVANLIVDKIHHENLLSTTNGKLAKRRISMSETPQEIASPYRKKRQEDSTYILGLSCFYHNSAASLIKDGAIIAAAEEERFSRMKNDRRFPHHAVNFCLEQGKIHQNELAAVVYYDNPYLTFERLLHSQSLVSDEGLDNWLRFLPSWLQHKIHLPDVIRTQLKYDGTILQENHHRSHCASAYYPSPFNRAAILTVDGVGEWATATIGVGRDSKLDVLKEMNFPHSLGLLYSAFTQFTGFKVNSGEYKMMGLAPYGEPKYVDTIRKHLVDIKEDGSLELNLEYFAFLAKPSMTNDKFGELFDGPARPQESRITRREIDIAKSIQVVTEEIILKMARHASKTTGEKNLCLSGGVALNCVANGRLLREGPFEDVWIQPAAGDSGSAVGAALDVYHTHFLKPRKAPNRSLQGGSYLGPEFSSDEIRAFLDTHGYPYQELSDDERAQRLASYLKDGRVVGHFSGRMEFGPRALGSRSIIGDPRNRDMQVNLNVKIKYRESFRPFAPSVLEEEVSQYFELDRPSPYMLLVAPVKKERCLPFDMGQGDDLLEIVRQPRSDIPAVTHVDYSARIQTVNSADHPQYYELIRSFKELTGCGVIVNTSFNVRGEPIICTPYDAYRCFMRTEMDVLALESFILLKKDQPVWPEPKGHVEESDEYSSVEVDSPLLVKLKKMYRSDFIPLVRQWDARGLRKIHRGFRERMSTWEDCHHPADPFSIPAALDSPDSDARVMAHAILAQWEQGAMTDSLRPLVEKLLRLGLRHRRHEEVEEEVSDSVYVVF